MEINLDKLKTIAFSEIQKNSEKKQPAITLSEPILESGQYKTLSEQENALQSHIEGLQELQQIADENKARIDQNLEICKAYQANIKASSQLQIEIIKGTKAGEDIYSLFLKAIKAVSLMTDNEFFYNETEKTIRDIYGKGLQETAPLLWEIREAQTRLEKMEEAEQRETEPDSKKRLREAIEIQNGKIEMLNALLKAEPKERPA